MVDIVEIMSSHIWEAPFPEPFEEILNCQGEGDDE